MKNVFLNRIVIIFCFLLLGTGSMFAEQIMITGVVSDEHMKPLAGVTVTVCDSVTKTGADGKYSIAANTTDTIVFSCKGYITQSIPINRRKVINVLLQPAKSASSEYKALVWYINLRQEALCPKNDFRIKKELNSLIGKCR